jgi:hypothetical protein
LKLQQKIESPMVVFGGKYAGLSGNPAKRASAEPYAQSGVVDWLVSINLNGSMYF